MSNLKYVGIFDYIEDTVRIWMIHTRIVYFLKENNKEWNRDGKLQIMLQKTISLFCQAKVQDTCLTWHKRFEIWAFILANRTSHSLLLELRHAGWDFSGHGWFMRLLLAQPSCGEWSVTITVSTNQTLCYNNFEI